jgi:hypothetical protein
MMLSLSEPASAVRPWVEDEGRLRMLYAVLCYNLESVVGCWGKEKEDAVMARHAAVKQALAAEGKLGPVARLMPTTAAVTVMSAPGLQVIDGPFAETKEQLLGFYVLDCANLEDAIAAARGLLEETGALEIRPIAAFYPGARWA